MGTFVDHSGKKFGRWTVLYRQGSDPRGCPMWFCKCQCGVERLIKSTSLTSGVSNSCGCLKLDNLMRHGQSKVGTMYAIWYNMLQRCHNPINPAYKNYGARGISVCKRWRGQDGVNNFILDMGQRPSGLTLDRKDNNKGYSKANCRWATYSEQNRNKRRKQENQQ